ncbi:MAG: hypothetical protein QM728_11680 [Gordonia sp. (in: high G+C Gram-positive bacteria)]|uniref:hypothetical protein n=1 Tax=Gordonia sp. (in: high G+C Gram-positive bacteria) TaxID=84139 RepID=UPI0039E33177
MVITKTALGAAVLAAAVGASLATAAPAEAKEIRHVAKVACRGISPNIVDRPYAGRITTTQWLPSERGHVTIYIWQSASLFGYQTRPQLAWHNLTTNRRGHASTISYNSIRGGDGASFNNIRTGAGRVRLTMYAKSSNWFVRVRSSTCATTVRVY